MIRSQDERVDAFLREIADVCKKHGFSIGHEDSHGGFTVVQHDQYYLNWLMGADRSSLPEEKHLSEIITKGTTNA